MHKRYGGNMSLIRRPDNLDSGDVIQVSIVSTPGYVVTL